MKLRLFRSAVCLWLPLFMSAYADNMQRFEQKMLKCLEKEVTGSFARISSIMLICPLTCDGSRLYGAYFLKTEPDSSIHLAFVDIATGRAFHAWSRRPVSDTAMIAQLLDTAYVRHKAQELAGQVVEYMQLSHSMYQVALVEGSEICNPFWRLYLEDGTEYFLCFSDKWVLYPATEERRLYFQQTKKTMKLQ